MYRTISLMLFATAVYGLSGCQCCTKRPVATQTTVVPGTPNCPPGGVFVPPPPAPAAGGPGVRVVPMTPAFPGPGAGPGVPPGITPPPPGAPVGPPPPPMGAPLPPGTSSQLGPRLEPNWQPAEGRGDGSRIAQAGPDPIMGAPQGAPQGTPQGAPQGTPQVAPTPGGAKLYPPDVGEKSTAEPPLLDEKPRSKGPTVDEKRTSSFPAGIAHFVPTIPDVPGVSYGLRPSISDGLDWLAKNGYKTVLHLHAPSEVEGPDRTQVEKLGMTYVSLEIGPKTLTRERFDEFAKLIGTAARQPMFVYDQDGALAGPLWYLYFRKVSGDNDDNARVRADRLGLRPDREGPHRLMWLAVQKFLEDNP
jgi:protein tyrosine phosphatase (PTP) superfamily phosphohydrolase (DUF442 family)